MNTPSFSVCPIAHKMIAIAGTVLENGMGSGSPNKSPFTAKTSKFKSLKPMWSCKNIYRARTSFETRFQIFSATSEVLMTTWADILCCSNRRGSQGGRSRNKNNATSIINSPNGVESPGMGIGCMNGKQRNKMMIA